MCHQSVDCYDSEDYRLRLSDVIYDMKVFLNQHPSETILLQVKCDRTENDAENETWKYFKNMAEKGELYCVMSPRRRNGTMSVILFWDPATPHTAETKPGKWVVTHSTSSMRA